MNYLSTFLVFAFLACCFAADLDHSCIRPNNSQVAADIYKEQPEVVEGKTLVVVSVYYNCIQWNQSLTHVERLVVSVILDLDFDQERQRWVLYCQADGSFNANLLDTGSPLWSTANESEFNCGACVASTSSPPCTGCDASCLKNRCYGTGASQCCDCFRGGVCVSSSGSRYRPGPNDTCGCVNHWVGAECQECSLQCQNGASQDSNCTSCLCPPNYSGQFCQIYTPPTTDTVSEEPTPTDCSLHCIHGTPDSSCTSCECSGNWQGSDCSRCDLDKVGDNCTHCSKAGHFLYKETGQCFPCGLYLCASCNFESAGTPENYNCTVCSAGSVPDPASKGHCTPRGDSRNPDASTSNGSNNIGLIIGLVVAGMVILTTVIIATIVIYRRRNRLSKSDLSLSHQNHKNAPDKHPANAAASKTDNPLYKPPEEVADASQSQGGAATTQQPVGSQPHLYDSLDNLLPESDKSGSNNAVYDTLKGVQNA